MNELRVPPRRMLAGLALTGVPVLVMLVLAWSRMGTERLSYRTALWSVPLLLACLIAGVVAASARTAPDEGERRRRMAAVPALAAFVLAWFVVLSLGRDWVPWSYAPACLPPTLLGVVLVRRAERNRRMPWTLVAVAFLWGACVATALPVLTVDTRNAVLDRLLVPGDPFVYLDGVVTALVEEGSKAIGVLAILATFRHRIHGVPAGLVIGSVLGAGFQFAETMVYLASADHDGMLYQYWTREYAGLFTSHALYTGLVGACLGLALQQRGRVWAVLCGAAGCVAAVAGHASWNTAAALGLLWHPSHGVLLVFVAPLANELMVHGPFLVLYGALVVAGLRFEVRGLGTELRREAATGLGAVRPAEVTTLSSASRRFRTRLALYRRRRYDAYRWLRTLHAAQLELAYARWHRARGEGEVDVAAETRLRLRVAAVRAAEPTPEGSPA